MENKKLAIKISSKGEFEAVKEWFKSNGADAIDNWEYNKDYPYLIQIGADAMSFNGQHHFYIDCEIISFSSFSQIAKIKVEPEEIVIMVSDGLVKVILTKEQIALKNAVDSNIEMYLSPECLTKIYEAFQSLQGE